MSVTSHLFVFVVQIAIIDHFKLLCVIYSECLGVCLGTYVCGVLPPTPSTFWTDWLNEPEPVQWTGYERGSIPDWGLFSSAPYPTQQQKREVSWKSFPLDVEERCVWSLHPKSLLFPQKTGNFLTGWVCVGPLARRHLVTRCMLSAVARRIHGAMKWRRSAPATPPRVECSSCCAWWGREPTGERSLTFCPGCCICLVLSGTCSCLIVQEAFLSRNKE
jgi:hypothetical protein